MGEQQHMQITAVLHISAIPQSVVQYMHGIAALPQVYYLRDSGFGDSATGQLGEGTQVINYQVSPDEKWCLLMGISQGGAGVIKGAMQLYSRDKSVSQTLQGHAGCFHTMSVPGRSDKAQVLCFQEKKEGQPAKLFVMEVGRDASAGAAFRLAPVPIPVPGDAQNDFPVSM